MDQALHPAFVIREANAVDWIVVRAWADPGGESPPYRRSPGVTDYVARRGDEALGFEQFRIPALEARFEAAAQQGQRRMMIMRRVLE